MEKVRAKDKPSSSFCTEARSGTRDSTVPLYQVARIHSFGTDPLVAWHTPTGPANCHFRICQPHPYHVKFPRRLTRLTRRRHHVRPSNIQEFSCQPRDDDKQNAREYMRGETYVRACRSRGVWMFLFASFSFFLATPKPSPTTATIITAFE